MHREDIDLMAGDADARDEGAWPGSMLDRVRGWGWRRWLIGERHGGAPLSAPELLLTYQALGAADVALALIVTQHDGAVELIADGDGAALRDRLLPALAAGELHATLGISHLTTSRRGGDQPMRVRSAPGGYRFDGVMPWVTAADHATHIVTGGVLDDGQQLLACLPTDRAGLSIEPPFEMLAVESSHTSEVRCAGVLVGRDEVLRGPADKTLVSRSPSKALGVSAVGVGLARAMVGNLRLHAAAEPELARAVLAPYEAELARLEARFEVATRRLPASEQTKTRVRIAVNELLARAAVALVIAAKGSGMLRGERAQRLVREALFMQVWSAPTAVRLGVLGPLRPAPPST